MDQETTAAGPSDMSRLTLLGSATTTYRHDHPSVDTLEVFETRHTAYRWVVGLDCLEFTSVCPMTGQPDFGRILIRYIPDRHCVESKSLKLYLGCYRNHGAFHEDCVNQIATDLFEVMEPVCVRVFGDFNVRGGIAIRPLALRFAGGLSEEERTAARSLLADYDLASR